MVKPGRIGPGLPRAPCEWKVRRAIHAVTVSAKPIANAESFVPPTEATEATRTLAPSYLSTLHPGNNLSWPTQFEKPDDAVIQDIAALLCIRWTPETPT